MNFLQMIETACREAAHTKADQPFVMISLTEEVGELAQELKISHGQRTGPAGKDGVVGEAIDTILCAMDIIHSEVGHLDEVYLCVLAQTKINKWLAKERQKRYDEERTIEVEMREVPDSYICFPKDGPVSVASDGTVTIANQPASGIIQLQHINERFTEVQ